jgi:alpha-mannosidase
MGTPVIKDGKVLKPYKTEEGQRMDIGKWKGPDGNCVYTVLDPGGYGCNFDDNGNETPVNKRPEYLEMIKKNEEISGVAKKVRYFGTGDYGGSPKASSAKMITEALADNENGLYEVVMASTDQLYNDITPEEDAKMPVYDGELLIPHGYGAYTSRTINKRWNRKNELLADSAERAACAAALLTGEKYPAKNFDFAWKQFLWHQFHDDLPGTSIPSANAFSHNDYIVSLNMFATELKNSIGAISETLKTDTDGIPVVVYNPVANEVNGTVDVKTELKSKHVRVYDADGNEYPAQIKDGTVTLAAKVPAAGVKVFSIKESGTSGVRSSLSVTKSSVSNERFTVKIDKNGDICSVYDKKLEKEIMAGPSRFQITHDESRVYPSWEIDYISYTDKPKFVEGKAETEIVDNGPAKVSLKVTRHYGNSKFVQVISLCEGGDRVDVDCRIEWREQHSFLKLTFPFTAKNENADFDIGLGAITRGNTTCEPYYEYTHHQWADITDRSGEYGVSLINDCKYGIDKPEDGTLRLTLIHTPSWGALLWSAQCFQDFGTNIFRYSIAPHEGERTETPFKASAVNQPLIPFIAPRHDGKATEYSLVCAGGKEFTVKAVKKEEKGDRTIVRVQEMTGKGVKDAVLNFGADIIKASETNGYETDIKPVKAKGRELKFDLKPYEVKTFALTFKSAGKETRRAECISLSYDKRITSLNSKRSVGDLFNGISIPEELYEESITVGGIPFEMGKKGKMNGMICSGQTIKLPKGADTLWIVAAADGDRDAEFRLGGKRVSVHIQDFAENIGEWDLVGSKHKIAKIKRDDLAACYTHSHNADGDRLYQFAYLFRYSIDVRHVRQITFPCDENIVVTAATVTFDDSCSVKPANLLYDSSETEKTFKVTLKTELGEEIKEVGAEKTFFVEAPLTYENGKVFKRWTGDGIIFTDDTRALVAVTKDITLTAETMDFGKDILEKRPCKANILHEGFNNPENALDGTGKRFWQSKFDENGEAYIEVFLGGTKTISRWLTQGTGARNGFKLNNRDFRLEYKMRRKDEWKIADAVKDNTDTLTVREFAPVKANIVRIVFTNDSKDENYNVRLHRFCLA